MSLDLSLLGTTWDGGNHRWDARDAMLYALGVGAGIEELSMTTENTLDTPQQVLPTFAVVLNGDRTAPAFGNYSLTQVLHTEQSLTLLRPIPTDGEVTVTGRVVAMNDKGRDAQIVTEQVLTLPDGAVLARLGASMFVRGEGGFGGDRGASAPWEAPSRPADEVVTFVVPETQALLYRLSGDRNPLHSDPSSAARSGFERPILHGLCTFGYTARALLRATCESDPGLFENLGVRFTSSVYPGDELAVRVWRTETGADFQTAVGDRVVLDRGTFTRRTP